MSIRSFIHQLLLVCAVSLIGAGTAWAQHHNMPHPPQPPQPPVFTPPTPTPPVPPTLRAPKPPATPPTAEPDTANTPEGPDDTQAPKIDEEKVPKFVYVLGDSEDTKEFAEPPKTPVVDEFFCDWYCLAERMFPDSDDPYAEYNAFYKEQQRIREERRDYISSGDAIPEELRLGFMNFTEVKYREDENGNGRFLLLLEGFGQEAIFSVSADDIDAGIAANLDKIRSVASVTAGYIQSQIDWNQDKADTFNGSEFDTERFLNEVKRYKDMLDGYSGPIKEFKPATTRRIGSTDTADATPDSVTPVAPGDVPTDSPITPMPDLDDPNTLIDAILADPTFIDNGMLGGRSEPESGGDATLRELIRTTRDFSNDEVLIDIDVIDNGNLGELANTMAKVSLDVGLAVAGAVNPTVGLTIAFGKNAKETYDYAISQGLSTRQAIFAATAAGAVGGADTYVMGLGIGKVAGWGADAIKGATKGALEHGVGTAGNASGFSLVGNVGKALVDKIVEKNKNPNLYQRPKRTLPTGPGQVTFIMAGGGNWQQNAVK
ncbi:MAG: hypothetical protein HEP70_12810 [Rhodobiaceae bacterium]|nr:hypothetical protein [Rhodobiaceae bacterium]